MGSPLQAEEDLTATPTRLLLVNDSPVLQARLTEVLDNAGFQLEIADRGQDGLRLAQRAVPPFDAFIVDARLPEMNGARVIEALRREPRGQERPILLLASAGAFADALRGLEAGADDYLVKSTLVPQELLVRLRAMLEARARQRRRLAPGLPPEPAHSPWEHPMQLVLDGVPKATVGGALDVLLARRADVVVVEADNHVAAHPTLWLSDASEVLGQAGQVPIGTVTIDLTPSTERRLALLDRGAWEVLAADDATVAVATRLESAVQRMHRWNGPEAARRQVLVQAMTDPGTGLYNRAYLMEHLRIELQRSQRYGEAMALVLVQVVPEPLMPSDRLVSAVGRHCAVRLKESTRNTDLVCRLWDMGFAVLLPRTQQSDALLVGRRIHEALASESLSGDGTTAPVPMVPTVAVSFAPRDGVDPERLLAVAEGLLAEAVAWGGGMASTLGAKAPDPDQEIPREALQARLDHVEEVLGDALGAGLDSPLGGIAAAARMLERRTKDGDPRAPLIREMRSRLHELQELLSKARSRLAESNDGDA